MGGATDDQSLINAPITVNTNTTHKAGSSLLSNGYIYPLATFPLCVVLITDPDDAELKGQEDKQRQTDISGKWPCWKLG